jgi:hypothetical protein
MSSSFLSEVTGAIDHAILANNNENNKIHPIKGNVNSTFRPLYIFQAARSMIERSIPRCAVRVSRPRSTAIGTYLDKIESAKSIIIASSICLLLVFNFIFYSNLIALMPMSEVGDLIEQAMCPYVVISAGSLVTWNESKYVRWLHMLCVACCSL